MEQQHLVVSLIIAPKSGFVKGDFCQKGLACLVNRQLVDVKSGALAN